MRRTRSRSTSRRSRTEIPELVGQQQADLVLVNDGDLTYTKIRLDERSLDTLIESIDKIADTLPRALCWGAAWDMPRDAEMAASDYVRLVLQGVGTESDLTAVGALLRQAQTALDYYTAPAKRTEMSERWQAGLRRLVMGAEPGSDHQLALIRAYARSARSDPALEFVAGLRSGDVDLPGLSVDTDLRWTLLATLARAGRADADEVDRELSRDDTISGRENAAAVLAMVPTAEAKRRAWEDAVVRDDVPNETQRGIAAAFYQHGQEDVLAEYRDKYLEMASTAWERLGVQRATVVLSHLFPRLPPSPETLAVVDRWLESAAANGAARRYVAEGRAEMDRQLTAQARDAL